MLEDPTFFSRTVFIGFYESRNTHSLYSYTTLVDWYFYSEDAVNLL